MSKPRSLRSLVVVSLVVSVALLLLPTAFSLAAPANFPPRPRTPTPVPVHNSGGCCGASIELQANAPATAWTVVQWAGGGQWFDVEGWRGDLGQSGRVKWWVAPKDFGTGPFRWVVYDKAGGQLVGISADFYLPRSTTEQVIVTMMPVPTATPTRVR